MDGVNIRNVGLDVLRSRLALVPQDSTLFLGTLRENLSVISFSTSNLTHCDCCRDPQGLRTDAELISVLQRAWLLPKDGPADPVAEAKFSLDSAVGDEGQPPQPTDLRHCLTFGLSSGANFSSGEKQLLALSRALVKNSKVIVLVRNQILIYISDSSYMIRRTRPPAMLMSRPTLNSSEPSKQNSHPLHCYALLTDSIP